MRPKQREGTQHAAQFAIELRPLSALSNSEDLKGYGLSANFKMVQDRFGATCHIRELNDPKEPYPYRELFKLFREIDYSGWILIEAGTDPADKVAAMTEQRKIFDEMVSRS